MSRSYTSSPPCASAGVMWDCFFYNTDYFCYVHIKMLVKNERVHNSWYVHKPGHYRVLFHNHLLQCQQQWPVHKLLPCTSDITEHATDATRLHVCTVPKKSASLSDTISTRLGCIQDSANCVTTSALFTGWKKSYEWKTKDNTNRAKFKPEHRTCHSAVSYISLTTHSYYNYQFRKTRGLESWIADRAKTGCTYCMGQWSVNIWIDMYGMFKNNFYSFNCIKHPPKHGGRGQLKIIINLQRKGQFYTWIKASYKPGKLQQRMNIL
jgi:hypothetical protein